MKHLFIALLMLALPFSIQAKKSHEQDKTLLECKGVYDLYVTGDKTPSTKGTVEEFRVNRLLKFARMPSDLQLFFEFLAV